MRVSGFAPWQQRIYDQACESIDAGRLAHGLLFCGPANLGKRAVAERLARRLLCRDRGADGEPCGRCRACQLLSAGTHPDFAVVSFVPNREGTRMRTEIVIEQIRELSEKLTLTPQYGEAQVAIIDPADAVNHAACNALLKTLEEPVPGRYLWLVSAHPARLPATIRSRCQKLEFRLPPQAEATAWLAAQGHPQTSAAEALDAARGHPGLADAWLRDGALKLRREVANDLTRLRRGEIAALETAQRWTADEDAGLRLRFAADLVLAEAAGLTDPARTRSLAAWFDAANRTRDLLRTTVRADLAVADLLLSWRGDAARTAGSGR
ncbi:DNA polymerase III subunit delta' [Luteimonas gilva]|uniref:DNA-directed DNA polymerase n=1 Tax=Luteimonas gilva TaxID=2572684 RepID=A0A4U5K1X6_9GAMM|nr:DNA polymerase III subunit delta' [Luteimonas gilva]TKR32939.1 DNA polymerase III subunit delta' [Luteimonas gilva]